MNTYAKLRKYLYFSRKYGTFVRKSNLRLAKHVFRGALTKKSMHGKRQTVKRTKNEKTHISNEKMHFLFLPLMINCK